MVVVETRIDNNYRSYLYPNWMLRKCGDAKHLIEITQIMSLGDFAGLTNLIEESQTHRQAIAGSSSLPSH